MNRKKIVTTFWNEMKSGRYEKLRPLFHEDSSIVWPNTKEVFSVSEYIKVNESYPEDGILTFMSLRKQVILYFPPFTLNRKRIKQTFTRTVSFGFMKDSSLY